MIRKSKRLAQLQQKRDDEPNTICQICQDWCNPVASGDAACEYCPHSYHDKCLSSQFRDRNFNMCSELDQQCDNESPPIRFALGKQQDQTVHTTKKKHKKKSQRTAPTPKKKPKSCVHGIHKTIYDSFEYCGVTYQNGDDVVLDNCGNGMVKDLDIARITDIYSYDDDRMPKIAIIYYHQASQIRECKTTEDEFDQETADREIYIDETYPSHANIDELFSRTSSSKALVVGSREHYLQEKQRKNSDDLYHDIYWCTHSYHHQSERKQLLPSCIIETKRTTGITPMNTKKTRKRDRKAMINQALNDASKALMLSAVPKYLPCREKEHDEIEAYMKQQIMSRGQGSGLYISGMPGTGKTATVRQIANELKRHVGRGKKKRKKQTTELPDFEFVEINAMKLPTPQHIYTELTKQLLGKHFAPNTAVRKLVKYFSTKDDSRKVIVLLVDELDFLLTRQQKVIYNLFDWPTKAEAKLVVIGIANTMDLPERLLPRVSSRLGTQRVVFKSYARHQLTEIIEQRLESTKVFSADAIRFCASAVAGVSGDCRTALQICRRAVEIAQKDVAQNGIAQLRQSGKHNTKRVKTRSKNKIGKAKCDWENDYGEEIVTLQHLRLAKDQFDLTNDIQIVSMCSIYEKLFLTAIVMWNTRSNDLTATTRTYKQKFDNFVQTSLGDSKMPNVHFRNMVDRLIDAGILKMCFDHNDGKEFTTLNVNMDEAVHALKENDVCARILSTLQAV
eukprot:180780_1